MKTEAKYYILYEFINTRTHIVKSIQRLTIDKDWNEVRETIQLKWSCDLVEANEKILQRQELYYEQKGII